MLPRFLCALLCVAAPPAFAQRPPASPPPPRGAILAEDPLAHAREVATAEKAFAQMAKERGAPAAFRACFTADGQVFAPGPRPVAEVYDEPEGKPPGYRLEWTPEWVLASADGTLGFSTGPANLILLDEKGAPKGPERHNWFFSIWRTEAPGRWRVLLDAGVTVPPRGEALDRIPCRMVQLERPTLAEGGLGLPEEERAFHQAVRESGLGAALSEWLREDSPGAGDAHTRWYREGGRRWTVVAASWRPSREKEAGRSSLPPRRGSPARRISDGRMAPSPASATAGRCAAGFCAPGSGKGSRPAGGSRPSCPRRKHQNRN